MTLTLRDGWAMTIDASGYIGWGRIGAPDALAYVIMTNTGAVYAYPFGKWGEDSGELCDSLLEAHAYLLSVGSESPWEAP
jgi:hypothetical protein